MLHATRHEAIALFDAHQSAHMFPYVREMRCSAHLPIVCACLILLFLQYVVSSRAKYCTSLYGNVAAHNASRRTDD